MPFQASLQPSSKWPARLLTSPGTLQQVLIPSLCSMQMKTHTLGELPGAADCLKLIYHQGPYRDPGGRRCLSAWQSSEKHASYIVDVELFDS